MRKVLLSLLVVVLLLAALGAAGYAGYQYGYRQGVESAADESRPVTPWGWNVGPRGMHNFGFERGFGRGFGMMDHGVGFGFLSPLMFLARILFWALVIGAIVLLVTRSGWRLTRTTPTAETTSPPPTVETREP